MVRPKQRRADHSFQQLGNDVLALTDALGIRDFAFCGRSLGGAIGQWLGVNAPDPNKSLILASTSPKFGPPEQWDTRKSAVLAGGMEAIVDLAIQRFFSSETLARGHPQAKSIKSVFLGTNPLGYAGCCAALRDFDQSALLRRISAPTLVVTGDRDVSTPWAGHGEILAREIPGAKSIQLAAAHPSNIERPHSFTAAVAEFLQFHLVAGDALQNGSKIRRAVLGNEHVDRCLAEVNDLNREFQDLITRYAWGTVWTRPALDTRTRRLLVLAMTAALGRQEEFRLHSRAGLRSELELSTSRRFCYRP